MPSEDTMTHDSTGRNTTDETQQKTEVFPAQPTEKKSVMDQLRSRLEESHVMGDLWSTIVEVLISVLPVVLFLLFFNSFVLKQRLTNPAQTYIGLLLAIVGLIVFTQGLKMGFLPLGENVGQNLTQSVASSAWLVLLFVFVLGYGVTLAEPSLQALGIQVEELSAGVIKKNLVVHAVALGVGMGGVAGMLKIIYQASTGLVLAVAYAVAITLSFFAPKTIVGAAFDAGAVTTGPVTVPIIMALGVGVASALGGRDPLIDGFGLVTLTAVGPVISMLCLGIIFKM